MKLKYYLITTILIFVGCSENENKPPIDNLIKLSCYSVHFLAGDEYIIDVLSDSKKLSLQEKNPEVASAWWTNNGKSIRIKGENIGSTSIYITASEQTDATTEIKVISDYFYGNYKEDGSKAIATVHCDEKDVQDKIEKELKRRAEQRTGTMYSFNKNLNAVMINEPNGNTYSGEYDWKINRLRITINKNTYDYLFQHTQKGIIELELDLLDVYKQVYPEAVVRTVKLLSLLSQIE